MKRTEIQQNNSAVFDDRQPFQQQADENNTSLQVSFKDWSRTKKLRKPAPVSRMITHKQRNQHKLSKSMDKSRRTRRKHRGESVEMTEPPLASRQELMTPDHHAVSFSNTVKVKDFKRKSRGKSAAGNSNSRLLASSYGAVDQTTAAS